MSFLHIVWGYLCFSLTSHAPRVMAYCDQFLSHIFTTGSTGLEQNTPLLSLSVHNIHFWRSLINPDLLILVSHKNRESAQTNGPPTDSQTIFNSRSTLQDCPKVSIVIDRPGHVYKPPANAEQEKCMFCFLVQCDRRHMQLVVKAKYLTCNLTLSPVWPCGTFRHKNNIVLRSHNL